MPAPLNLPVQIQNPLHVLTLDVWFEDSLREIIKLEQDASSFPWPESAMRMSLKLGHDCLALRDPGGAVLAYTVISRVLDEAEILIVSVSKQKQRQGLARLLLSELFNCLKSAECTRVLLEVRASNKAAITLYKKLGFDQDGLRPKYYSLPESSAKEDAVLMSLVLP